MESGRSKQELKEAYKQIKKRAGVFQIRNVQNGKVFLGSSVDLDAIWNRNRLQLNVGSHPNSGLQKDWKAIGEANFSYEILSEVKIREEGKQDVKSEAQALLALFMDELKPFGEAGYH